MKSFIEYSPAVLAALNEKKPILALESTLLTHGLPYPQNIEIASEVESIALNEGVVPATIAILNGKIKIGLTASELQILVTQKSIRKASKRELPFLLSQGLSGGTTVAATMYCAHLANIAVFATGGIGGVHRGEDVDISADLIELARTPVAVVCAGAKAILDIPRTLEYLETQSVPIVGYQTETFPAFYSASSDHVLNETVTTLADLVKVVETHRQLQFTSGMIIANPIPKSDEIPAHEIEPAIAIALQLAQMNHIHGKALTPFLLQEIAKITDGRSIKANLQLIRNNVTLGARLAHGLFAHTNHTLTSVNFR